MARRAEAAGDGERETVLGREGQRALEAVEHRRDVEGTVLHQAVRGHLASFLAETAERGGLPRFVERDFARYLACGVPSYGFARLACAACRSEVLVPFSCKSRGVCPSCNARRAYDTAIHLVERVLPRAPYRQWTLSLPMPVRFCLARDAQLLSEVLRLFVRALFVFQRRTARRLGVSRPLPGAVAFVQRFGSALQLTPHFHVLVPEAVFEEVDEAELRLHSLPRPTDREVETLAVTVARRTLALLRARGVLEEEAVPDGALDVLQLEGIQVPRSGPRPAARRPGRRSAFVEGFSLHADTWLHENDVTGLERLCNYGARGPFLRRVAALVPPPGPNLVRYFGVFAPNARVRPRVVPAPLAPTLPEAASCPVAPEPVRQPRPRRPIPWAELLKRTFQTDVLTCPRCGGTRRVVAVVLRSSTAQAILELLRLPSKPLPLAPAWVLVRCSPSLETPARPTTGTGVLYPQRREHPPRAPPARVSPRFFGPATRPPPGLRRENPVCSSLDHDGVLMELLPRDLR